MNFFIKTPSRELKFFIKSGEYNIYVIYEGVFPFESKAAFGAPKLSGAGGGGEPKMFFDFFHILSEYVPERGDHEKHI